MTRMAEQVDQMLAAHDPRYLTGPVRAPGYAESWDHGVYTEAVLRIDEKKNVLQSHLDKMFSRYEDGQYDAAIQQVQAAITEADKMLAALHRASEALTSIAAGDGRTGTARHRVMTRRP